MAEISWEQFEAVDMRVGRVVGVEEFPEARVPAWKLEIDFGPQIGRKRSSAQITNYARDALEGRLVVAVVNFPPKRIGPFVSEVLLLGAIDEGKSVILLRPDQDVEPGDRIALGSLVKTGRAREAPSDDRLQSRPHRIRPRRARQPHGPSRRRRPGHRTLRAGLAPAFALDRV